MVGRNVLEHPAAQSYDILAPKSTELNLLDLTAVTEYMSEHSVDMVIHAAGVLAAYRRISKPLLLFWLIT